MIDAFKRGTEPELIAYYYNRTLKQVEAIIASWLDAQINGNARKANPGHVDIPVRIRCETDGCSGYSVDRFRGKWLCRKCLTGVYDAGYIEMSSMVTMSAPSALALAIDEEE